MFEIGVSDFSVALNASERSDTNISGACPVHVSILYNSMEATFREL